MSGALMAGSLGTDEVDSASLSTLSRGGCGQSPHATQIDFRKISEAKRRKVAVLMIAGGALFGREYEQSCNIDDN